jgi:signal transduction histidine kinase
MQESLPNFGPQFSPADPQPKSPISDRASGNKSLEDRLRLLVDTGLLLASERSLDVIAQATLDAGLRLSGAQFGAFFYNNLDPQNSSPNPNPGDTCSLYKTAGSTADAGAFAAFPILRVPDMFTGALSGPRLLRLDDITLLPDDPRYGAWLPFREPPSGHSPVRSYMAVPIRSRSGQILGGLLYGHPEPGIFPAECEDLVATIASQAAVAIDNARLAANLSHEISLAEEARRLQRETANRLRQALDAAQLGTWTWDFATDLLDLDEHAAQLLRTEPHVPITRSELRNRIVYMEDREATTSALQRALDEGGLYSAEYRVDEPSGIQTWISSTGIPTFAPDSTIITGMIGTLQDITTRKTSEATLRQSEKLAATGRLAATIAHEINNPLEAVTNLIYLARTDPDIPRPAQELLETADNELARVAQIAQQTLGFYRDTSRPVEIDLNALLSGVVDLFHRKMQSSRISCELDLEPGLHIFGLQGEIRQVFSNLVVNAIDASSGGTTIRLRARQRHCHNRHGVSTVICDQGSGIPQGARSRMFSPFFTTKQSVGTGLGLWVTRGIVEKQGGCIHFRTRSESPSGTVFRVFLPSLAQIAPTGQSASTRLQ